MMNAMQSNEQEFAELSSHIRNMIETSVKPASSSAKRRAVETVEADLDELSDIVEQMELEAREYSQPQRGQLLQRVETYRQDAQVIKKELRKAAVAYTEHLRDELVGDAGGYDNEDMTGSDSRQLLLRDTERIQQTSRNLQSAQRQALEIEQVGIGIMDNLNSQRETINHARTTLDETDSNLKRSMRVANAMARRIVQNKVLMYLIIGSILALIALIIYLKVT